MISFWGISEMENIFITQLFPYNMIELDIGLKYLGFQLKENMYKKCDWQWLIEKVEKKLNTWCNQWLSKGGCMILVKVILVYWMSRAWIPKGVLESIRILWYMFIWSGDHEK